MPVSLIVLAPANFWNAKIQNLQLLFAKILLKFQFIIQIAHEVETQYV